MLTTCTDDEVTSSDENDDRALEAVVHYIMVHLYYKRLNVVVVVVVVVVVIGVGVGVHR